MYGKRIPKKFPANTDLLYIRSWIGQFFKIKDMSNVVLKYKVRNNDVYDYIDIDEMTKGLDYFGIQSGTEFVIDPKEAKITDEDAMVQENIKVDENSKAETVN